MLLHPLQWYVTLFYAILRFAVRCHAMSGIVTNYKCIAMLSHTVTVCSNFNTVSLTIILLPLTRSVCMCCPAILTLHCHAFLYTIYALVACHGDACLPHCLLQNPTETSYSGTRGTYFPTFVSTPTRDTLRHAAYTCCYELKYIFMGCRALFVHYPSLSCTI